MHERFLRDIISGDVFPELEEKDPIEFINDEDFIPERFKFG